MQRSSRVTVVCLLLLCVAGVLLLIASLGGGGGATVSSRVLTYRAGTPLHVHVADGGTQAGVRVSDITYSSVDGQRVPALLTTPTAAAPLGCVMYQSGYGQTAAEDPQVRSGLAQIRLATFTIDPRNTGVRGSLAQLKAAVKEPRSLRAMVLDTVVDLRVGLDYLESRAECHHNIAYIGTSFGAVVGTILAAEDPRIKAVVLTSVGPTFERGILVGSLAAKYIPGLPVEIPGAASDPAIMARAVQILGPYDPDKWIGQIAPRPVLLINGRNDPLVAPIDALQMAAAAGQPKTLLYFNGGHDPFAPGPGLKTVDVAVALFLINNLNLPNTLTP